MPQPSTREDLLNHRQAARQGVAGAADFCSARRRKRAAFTPSFQATSVATFLSRNHEAAPATPSLAAALSKTIFSKQRRYKINSNPRNTHKAQLTKSKVQPFNLPSIISCNRAAKTLRSSPSVASGGRKSSEAVKGAACSMRQMEASKVSSPM